jgi:hypothetical protein
MPATELGAAVLLKRFGTFMRCTQLQFGRILYSKNVSIFMVEIFLMTGRCRNREACIKSNRPQFENLMYIFCYSLSIAR